MKPIPVEFVGGPLCGQTRSLPQFAMKRFTTMKRTGSGAVIRHVYKARVSSGDGAVESLQPLKNGNYPMDWIPGLTRLVEPQ